MTNEEKICHICADVMGLEKASVTLTTSRNELSEFDSLSIIQVIAEMEDKFSCSISEECLNTVKIEKVEDFLKLLK